MADRALLTGYPRIIVHEKYRDNEHTICLRRWTVLKTFSLSYFFLSDVHCITLFPDIYLFSVALTKRAITGKLTWLFIWKDNHRQWTVLWIALAQWRHMGQTSWSTLVQVITWTNIDLLSIVPLGTIVREIFIKYTPMKMHLKLSAA